MAIFVGVDGGGTRATAVAVDAAGKERARIEGDAGLVDPGDPTARAPALAALTRSVLEACGEAAAADALCCGLAGAGRERERAALEAALVESGVARTVRVTTDAEAAMHDAFGGESGILLIAGTGSIAWARAEDGSLGRAGGWGQILGDDGSGFAIGHAALRYVARAHDGRTAPTRLTELVLASTRLDAPERLIAWTAIATKGEIAALAPAVFNASEAGDAAAAKIVRRAARDLADHALALVNRLAPWSAAPRVALSGGLLLPDRPLRHAVIAALTATGRPFDVLDRSIDAAAGAAALARAAARG